MVLARRLGWRFVDLDDVVEAREHRSIADIFRAGGEAGFRQAETSALREVLSQPHGMPLVIALGGGAFVQPENAAALQDASLHVVFLDASLEELRRRCAPQAGERPRPLLGDERRFRQLYEQRRDSYRKAHLRIETTGLEVAQVATVILESLQIEDA